jgi:hypothetical protein
MKNPLFLLFFLIYIGAVSGQNLYEFGFERDFSVTVKDIDDDTLHFAWWGGLNSVQFSEMDINQDGITDLILFDRHGSRLLPLINENIPGQFSYRYAPEYRKNFPTDIHDWIITYDFDNDGKMDIFTYSVGGIRVFKNISDSTGLKFYLWSNLINSLQYSNYINIYLTDVDYPIITDIDDDGDVDILAFFGLGSFVEWHRNMGVELHGNADTMDFHRTHRCWGNFMESEMSNNLSLGITCPWQKDIELPGPFGEKEIMHVGSTMNAFDVNGDGLKDLLLGDTDYANLILVINGGTSDSAHFVSQDINFPSNTVPVQLFSIPLSFFLDINNDNKKELIVSTFDPSPIINETRNSVWLYNNNGTNDSLDLIFIQDNFIQDKMIELGSAAYPVIQDWNGDGLSDIFVANYGTRDSSWYDNGFLYSSYTSSISLFENIGTTNNPQFKHITDDFAGLSSLGLMAIYPAFADLDGDGDIDMVIGNQDGTLLYFENTAGAGNPMNMILNTANWLGIDVGLFSTPSFFDLTKNGLPDLVVGQRMGYLSYWENTGTLSTPVFTHRTDTLGDVYTADLTHSYYGHSIPYFYRNSSDETFLFTGSNKGWLLHYNNIDNNLNGTFQLIDTLFVTDGIMKEKIVEGARVSPAVADMNNDSYPELIVGNYCGGLSYYRGVLPPPDTVGIADIIPLSDFITVYPNPFLDEITILSDHFFKSMNIILYSSHGLIIRNEQAYHTNRVHIISSNIPAGFYFLRITIETNSGETVSTIKKIIKY